MVISLIGLGEVGGYYSMGLAAGGAAVKGYDIAMGRPELADRFEQYRSNGVKLVSSMKELIEDSDIIIVVTSTAVALKTAAEAKPFLKKGQIYVELNSAVPQVKNEIAQLLDGIDVVDGATMASANQEKQRTLICISGPRGKEVSEILNQYGLNTSFVGEKMGQASAQKVLRSIFMKGLEAVLMESLYAAYSFDVLDAVYQSILEFFEGKTMDSIFKMLVTTDAIHAKRRGEEVEAVARLLETSGIDNTMSIAAAKKLEYLAGMGMKEHYQGNVPKDMIDVLQQLAAVEAERKDEMREK